MRRLRLVQVEVVGNPVTDILPVRVTPITELPSRPSFWIFLGCQRPMCQEDDRAGPVATSLRTNPL